MLAGKEFNQLEKTLNFEGDIFYCYDASLACFWMQIYYSLRSKKSCGILILAQFIGTCANQSILLTNNNRLDPRGQGPGGRGQGVGNIAQFF